MRVAVHIHTRGATTLYRFRFVSFPVSYSGFYNLTELYVQLRAHEYNAHGSYITHVVDLVCRRHCLKKCRWLEKREPVEYVHCGEVHVHVSVEGACGDPAYIACVEGA